MKKYLIFDFDGLILDTEYAWYQAYQKWFQDHFHYHLNMDLFISCVGTTNHKFLKKCSQLLNTYIDPVQFKQETNEILYKLCSSLPPMDGLCHLLDYAKENHIVCSVVSNSPKSWSVPHLIRNQILDDFDLIVTPLTRKEMKPSSAMYQRLINFYACLPEEVLVLEDSPSGLESAKKENIDVAIIENRLTPYMQFQKAPDYRLKSLEDVIFQILEE